MSEKSIAAAGQEVTMAPSLLAFLMETPVDGITEEVNLGERFPAPFVIKPMSTEAFDELQKTCTRFDAKTRAPKFDSTKFMINAVVECCVTPDFRNADAIQKGGFISPERFVSKRLKPGEIARLAAAIQRLSGFDEEINDLIDEAKN